MGILEMLERTNDELSVEEELADRGPAYDCWSPQPISAARQAFDDELLFLASHESTRQLAWLDLLETSRNVGFWLKQFGRALIDTIDAEARRAASRFRLVRAVLRLM